MENKDLTQKTNKDVKVICYVRASTDHQEVESQRNEVMSLILRDGYDREQVIPIGGAGISAVKAGDEYKELYREMYDAIATENIECVYAWSVNRLVRFDEVGFAAFKTHLIERHINLKTYSGNMSLLNPDGTVNAGVEIALSLFSVMAKQDAIELKEKTARGRKKKLEEGYRGGGRPPYGYMSQRTKHGVLNVVCDEEAEIIRRVYREYLAGSTANAIGKGLRNEGLVHQATQLGATNFVLKILRDVRYTGANSMFPGIVEPSDHNIVCNILDNATSKYRDNPKHNIVYYGKKIVRYQGIALSGLYRDGAYTLSTRNEYGISRVSVSVNSIDSLLLHVANEFQDDYEYNESERRADLEDKIATTERIVAAGKAEIDAIRTKLEKIADMYVSGLITRERVDQRRKAIQGDENAVRERINIALRRKEETLAELESMGAKREYTSLYNITDDSKRAEIIRRKIERCDIDPICAGKYIAVITLNNGLVLKYELNTKARTYYFHGIEDNPYNVRINARFTEPGQAHIPHLTRIPRYKEREREAMQRRLEKERVAA